MIRTKAARILREPERYPTSSRVSRRYELDFVRVVSMFAVVAIHVTSTFIAGDSAFTILGMNAAFLLNQNARFAVPMFVLLSGASLSLGSELSAAQFWKRRVKTAVVPYVLWCVFYYAFETDYSLNVMFAPDAGNRFLHGLLTGNFVSHLYFMVVIIQLYALYIPLRTATHKYGARALLFSFVVSLFFMLVIGARNIGVSIFPERVGEMLWLLAPTWLFFFVLGMWLTEERLDAVARFGERHIAELLSIFFVFSLFFPLYAAHHDDYTLSLKPAIIFYVCLMFPLLMGVSRCLPKLPFIAALAKVSGFVYFFHVYVLIRLRRETTLTSGGTRDMALLFVATAAISVVAALVVRWIIHAVRLKSQRESVT